MRSRAAGAALSWVTPAQPESCRRVCNGPLRRALQLPAPCSEKNDALPRPHSCAAISLDEAAQWPPSTIFEATLSSPACRGRDLGEAAERAHCLVRARDAIRGLQPAVSFSMREWTNDLPDVATLSLGADDVLTGSTMMFAVYSRSSFCRCKSADPGSAVKGGCPSGASPRLPGTSSAMISFRHVQIFEDLARFLPESATTRGLAIGNPPQGPRLYDP